jgi:hypothetical protein
MACRHGWSEAAASAARFAEPVESLAFFWPAPTGRRNRPLPAKSIETIHCVRRINTMILRQPPKNHKLGYLISAILLTGFAAFIAYRLHGSVPPWISTEGDPVSAQASRVDLLHASDFQFTFDESGFGEKYKALTVTADGTSIYTFRTFTKVPQNKKAEFHIDSATMTDLRNLLLDLDFFRRKKSYVDRSIVDGTQRSITVTGSGIEKSTYFDNYFPEFEERIRTFVTTRILTPHTGDIDAATPDIR